LKIESLRKLSFAKIFHSLWLGPLGAILAWSISAPAPFLTGPTTVCSLAALLGLKFIVPEAIKNFSFVVIGLTIGSNVTPETLIQASKWPFSIICMLTSVVLITILGRYILVNLLSMDRESSILASSPGHLSFVLSISSDLKRETAKITVIQNTRVLILVLLTPLVVTLTKEDANLDSIVHVSRLLSLFEMFILIVVSVCCGFLIRKTKIPAPFLIAGMLWSTISNGSGLTSGEVSPVFSVAAFIILGTLIGTRFVSVNIFQLRSSFFGGVLQTLVGALFVFLFAYITHKATGLNFVDTIIAFAPGGLEAMVAMGALVQADPTYVAIHHIARIFFLSFLVPFLIYKKDLR